MKVKDLKKLLANQEGLTSEEFDNLDVLIPAENYFDGFWKRPDLIHSGVATLGEELNSTDSSVGFLIVPEGFFDIEISPELN